MQIGRRLLVDGNTWPKQTNKNYTRQIFLWVSVRRFSRGENKFIVNTDLLLLDINYA